MSDNVVQFPLTEEEVETIAQEMDKAIEGTPLETLSQMPSNQGTEETDPEKREPGEYRQTMVSIDPATGEHKILGHQEGLDDNETFEEMYERVQKGQINLETPPVTEKELISFISDTKNQSMIAEIVEGVPELKPETIKTLLDIVNRKMNREDFNIYKAFPEEIRKLVDQHLCKSGVPINTVDGKHYRNFISEALINDFIYNINADRTITDFNKEIEELFTKNASDIAESVVGYTEERNRKYREYAEKMEDPKKKEQVLLVLDQIEEGYNLTNLKEFAKRCRIKKFDLEKPSKIYNSFLSKYEDSSYNIYSIEMAANILERHINEGLEEPKYSASDIFAFFLCFCKQCMNMSPEVVTDHAYMYYVIYNIVIMDMNKSENTKYVSDTYLGNIREVIDNLRSRNDFLNKIV